MLVDDRGVRLRINTCVLVHIRPILSMFDIVVFLLFRE